MRFLYFYYIKYKRLFTWIRLPKLFGTVTHVLVFMLAFLSFKSLVRRHKYQVDANKVVAYYFTSILLIDF